jgi:hypothetical protein
MRWPAWVEKGVWVTVPTKTGENDKAKALQSALRKAGIKASFTPDNRLAEDDAGIMVGYVP